MKRVEIHSEDYHRDLALRLLKQHRRETQFQIHNINMLTVYELEERGCEVVFDYSKKGMDTVSSPVPFGRLVTKAEWRQGRLETLVAVLLGPFIAPFGNLAYAAIGLAIVFSIGFLIFAIKGGIGGVVKLLGL